MFSNRRMFVALAMCVCLSASPVFAGGSGGTKKDATYKIKNESTANQIGVIVDPPATLNPATATLDQFKAAGGKVITPGKTQDFSVKSGTHTLVVVGLAGTAPVILDQVTKPVGKGAVAKGFVDANGLLRF